MSLKLLLILLHLILPIYSLKSNIPNILIQDVANNLGFVTDLAFLDAQNILVTLKNGPILLIQNGKLRPQPVLDLSNWVTGASGDRGLESIAVDPQYPARPYIYVGFVWDSTPKQIYQSRGKYNRISRWTIKNGYAVAGSEKVLLGACVGETNWYGNDCSPQIGVTHMIGSLWFDNGALMVSIGDSELFEGVNWGDRGVLSPGSVPLTWAGPLDTGFLGGKILRISPDTGCGLQDNPFWNGKPCDAQSKVFAVGLRNPYRCTTSPTANTHVCGDVGWYSYESIKLISKGSNLGWPCFEGEFKTPWPATDSPACARVYANSYKATSPVPAFNPAMIVKSINHNGLSSAIIGGVFVPRKFPTIGGYYLYADFAQSTISAFSWPAGLPINVATGADGPVSFKVNPYDGNIYYLGQCAECSTLGILRKISVYAPPPPPTPTTTQGGLITLVPTQQPTIAACNPSRLGIAPLKPNWSSFMFLSTFPGVKFITNGWGPVGIDSSVGGPGTLDGNPLTIDKVRFTSGIGTKANANITVPISGSCYRFSAFVGMDDEVGLNNPEAKGEWIIRGIIPGNLTKPATSVILYNSTLAKKSVIKSGDVPWKIDIYNLHFYVRLYLETWTPYGLINNNSTHMNWADARFYCGPDAPYMPDPVITSPGPGFTAKIGQTVNFVGRASDFQGKTIPASGMTWLLTIRHCQGSLCHMHILTQFTGPRGSFVVQPHGDGSDQYYYYALRLTAKDSCGRVNFVERGIIVS